MEFNHESYGTKLERHFTSRIVINNQKIKRSLGNLSAMNHEFESSKWVIVVFFDFFWCEITSFKAWCQIRSRRDVGICPMDEDSWGELCYGIPVG